MGEEYRAKIFKSGNSLALRLPKGLGLKEGTEMVLREERQGFSMEPVEPTPRKIDISKFAGKAPWLKPIPPELREFEERPSTIAAREALSGGGGGKA
ncbi:AbrB/MazE/SpoVT family DNA-binding domain-containing protein [Sphingomonas sp. LT1P40]|uniref:AbrB/MazE/SpoVT family DNA-binding domain-containing protein n=1 Tax=Alteristakelama amylovorans TaxID=3096166 RepID=UPI002FCA9BF6